MLVNFEGTFMRDKALPLTLKMWSQMSIGHASLFHLVSSFLKYQLVVFLTTTNPLTMLKM